MRCTLVVLAVKGRTIIQGRRIFFIMVPIRSIGSLLFILIATSSAFATSTVPRTKTTTTKADLLFEEEWTSSLSPSEAREFLTTKSNWLSIVPECEDGTIQEETSEGDGAWSITATNGSYILCTDTVKSDKSFDDDEIDGCYLKYNVKVRSKDGLQMTIDIQYDISETSVRRIVYGFDTIGIKSKIFKPLIKGPLIELMQEENRRMSLMMNPKNPQNGKIIMSSAA